MTEEKTENVVTKDYLKDCLDERFAKFEEKMDKELDQKLKAFATKKDLEAFATKKDLEAFVTKKDLDERLRPIIEILVDLQFSMKNMVTRDEFEAFKEENARQHDVMLHRLDHLDLEFSSLSRAVARNERDIRKLQAA